jgi:hypothetical protein
MENPKYQPSEKWLRFKEKRERQKARALDRAAKEQRGTRWTGIRLSQISLAAAVIGLIAGGYYLVSPYLAVQGLRNGFLSRNADQVSEYIDYQALREDLKSQLIATALKDMQNDSQMAGNPFSGLATAMITPMITSWIDTYVTPSGVKALFESSSADGSDPNQTKQNLAERKKDFEKALKESSMGYEGIDRFQLASPPISVPGNSLDGQVVKYIFYRQGFASWKLKTVVLPKY